MIFFNTPNISHRGKARTQTFNLRKSIEVWFYTKLREKELPSFFHLNSSAPQNQLMSTSSVVALLYNFFAGASTIALRFDICKVLKLNRRSGQLQQKQ